MKQGRQMGTRWWLLVFLVFDPMDRRPVWTIFKWAIPSIGCLTNIPQLFFGGKFSLKVKLGGFAAKKKHTPQSDPIEKGTKILVGSKCTQTDYWAANGGLLTFCYGLGPLNELGPWNKGNVWLQISHLETIDCLRFRRFPLIVSGPRFSLQLPSKLF